MAIPVFEEEKWRCWDSDLRARSYIQSFLLEASAVQSRDHKGQTAPCYVSWFRIASIFMVQGRNQHTRNGDRTNAPRENDGSQLTVSFPRRE